MSPDAHQHLLADVVSAARSHAGNSQAAERAAIRRMTLAGVAWRELFAPLGLPAGARPEVSARAFQTAPWPDLEGWTQELVELMPYARVSEALRFLELRTRDDRTRADEEEMTGIVGTVFRRWNAMEAERARQFMPPHAG